MNVRPVTAVAPPQPDLSRDVRARVAATLPTAMAEPVLMPHQPAGQGLGAEQPGAAAPETALLYQALREQAPAQAVIAPAMRTPLSVPLADGAVAGLPVLPFGVAGRLPTDPDMTAVAARKAALVYRAQLRAGLVVRADHGTERAPERQPAKALVRITALVGAVAILAIVIAAMGGAR